MTSTIEKWVEEAKSGVGMGLGSFSQWFADDNWKKYNKHFNVNEPLLSDFVCKSLTADQHTVLGGMFVTFNNLCFIAKEREIKTKHTIPLNTITKIAQCSKVKSKGTIPEFVYATGNMQADAIEVQSGQQKYYFYGFGNAYAKACNSLYHAWSSTLGIAPVPVPKYPLQVDNQLLREWQANPPALSQPPEFQPEAPRTEA